ncbi:MAG: cel [Cytophagaceae bacterium]|jgi:ubiquinone/menaquinone biosynthesis C-methylase UbiE|nr:cel [Cytophagaceae bacterium]
MFFKTRTLFFILIGFSALTANAQSDKTTLWIDRFEKKDSTTLLKESWFTYTDASNGGASQIKKEIVPTDQKHQHALSLAFKLEKGVYKWNPYAAVVCSLSGKQLDMQRIDGIVYEYKGSDHQFFFRTDAVKDYAYYQYSFPESEDWTTVFIPFTTLGQPKWGKPEIFDKQDVHSLAWQVSGTSGNKGLVYLDNIRLVYQIDPSLLTVEQKEVYQVKTEQQEQYEQFIQDVLSNDSIQALVGRDQVKIVTYLNALEDIKRCHHQSDSLTQRIQCARTSKEKKSASLMLLSLSKNKISGDVYSHVRKMNSDLVLQCDKVIPLSSLYELEKKYLVSKAIADSNYAWAKELYNYAYTDKVNYTSGAISDSNFHYEIVNYHFKPNDVIAEIGAGRAFFERALSKYCDDLTVYVNELDSNLYQQFKTKLVFLERLDHTTIRFIPVQGTDSTANLPENAIDKIIIKNTFHHFDAPDKMLRDFKRSLKPGGSVFITDTMKDDVVNPECKQLMARSEVMKWMTGSGFVLVKETPMQYGKYKCLEFQLMQ